MSSHLLSASPGILPGGFSGSTGDNGGGAHQPDGGPTVELVILQSLSVDPFVDLFVDPFVDPFIDLLEGAPTYSPPALDGGGVTESRSPLPSSDTSALPVLQEAGFELQTLMGGEGREM